MIYFESVKLLSFTFYAIKIDLVIDLIFVEFISKHMITLIYNQSPINSMNNFCSIKVKSFLITNIVISLT